MGWDGMGWERVPPCIQSARATVLSHDDGATPPARVPSGALFMSVIIGTVASLINSTSAGARRSQAFREKVTYLDRSGSGSWQPPALLLQA